jgi:hypothetical protein
MLVLIILRRVGLQLLTSYYISNQWRESVMGTSTTAKVQV